MLKLIIKYKVHILSSEIRMLNQAVLFPTLMKYKYSHRNNENWNII